YTLPIEHRRKGEETFDLVRIAPAWLPEMVQAEVVMPLDRWVDSVPDVDLDDFHPLYRTVGLYDGRRYGYCDDGDCLILYYRPTVLASLGLGVPETWEEFASTAASISASMAPSTYGACAWLGTYG